MSWIVYLEFSFPNIDLIVVVKYWVIIRNYGWEVTMKITSKVMNNYKNYLYNGKLWKNKLQLKEANFYSFKKMSLVRDGYSLIIYNKIIEVLDC